MSHFKSQDKTNPNIPKGTDVDTATVTYQVGRYLCGLASEEDILKLATRPNRRSWISYYIGLRNQSEGRYGDASDWYRVVMETDVNTPEYKWAMDALRNWMAADKSLNRLADEKL